MSPKYVVSHHCHKELGLADLLRKPILPVMYERVPWPPPGAMALVFASLCYIDMKGKWWVNFTWWPWTECMVVKCIAPGFLGIQL